MRKSRIVRRSSSSPSRNAISLLHRVAGKAPGLLPPWVPARWSEADFALMKRFRYKERLSAQFRAEAFNLFNTPQFGRADTNLASGSFGSFTRPLNPPTNRPLPLNSYF